MRGSHSDCWRTQFYSILICFPLPLVQIMYAYVMRPETLPDSYNEFIVKTGPIARPVLKAVRESCRGGGIDVASLAAFVTSKTGLPMFGVHAHSPIIPCSAVHPDTASCLAHNTRATRATFKKTFPLYLSLTFVPFVVLNIQKVHPEDWMFFLSCMQSVCRYSRISVVVHRFDFKWSVAPMAVFNTTYFLICSM